MPFHRTAATLFYRQRAGGPTLGPITLAYKKQIKSNNLRLDEHQLSLSAALDALYSSLTSSSSSYHARYFAIPDEHLEAAAFYYGGSSSSFPSMSVSSLRNRDGNFNFASMAIATAHSIATATSSAVGISSPKGIYVHGSVGVGKSMLMDLFYSICARGYSLEDRDRADSSKECTNDVDPHSIEDSCYIKHYKPLHHTIKRCHFHEFMLDVHQRIHAYKTHHPKSDPIPSVAASLAKEARLLCFDEMQITDIADAMIVKRIVTLLLDLGVVIVATSNRPPVGLYEGGINRSVFLPFIETLNERMMVVEMPGRHDYRRDAGLIELGGRTTISNSDLGLERFIVMEQQVGNGGCHDNPLEQWFSNSDKNNNDQDAGESRQETIPVAMGRELQVPRANNHCAWFTFAQLCQQPLGAADYLAIADRYNMIIVEDVPQLGGHVYNEARRFVTLIDALYEARTKLIVSARVPRDDLFIRFHHDDSLIVVETNDGDEEIIAMMEDGTTTSPSLASASIFSSTPTSASLGEESFVIGEGGSSSSSSTTMIHTQDGKVEWSATGRIGVSLAQLSAVKEVSFSFQRAASRLSEMSAANWGS